jgi:hypothetical protein
MFEIGRLGIKQTAAPNKKEAPTGRGASPCRPAKARVASQDRAAERTPPAETTHWTASLMAKAVGTSASSGQRIWRAHGLQPHLERRVLAGNQGMIVWWKVKAGAHAAPHQHPHELIVWMLNAGCIFQLGAISGR